MVDLRVACFTRVQLKPLKGKKDVYERCRIYVMDLKENPKIELSLKKINTGLD